jgi:hypothetical protein
MSLQVQSGGNFVLGIYGIVHAHHVWTWEGETEIQKDRNSCNILHMKIGSTVFRTNNLRNHQNTSDNKYEEFSLHLWCHLISVEKIFWLF